MGRSYSGSTEIVRFGSVSFLYPRGPFMLLSVVSVQNFRAESMGRKLELVDKLEKLLLKMFM